MTVRVTHTVDVEVDAEYGDTDADLIAKATADLAPLERDIHAMVLRTPSTLTFDDPRAQAVLGYDPNAVEA